jgi:hypothetical protein
MPVLNSSNVPARSRIPVAPQLDANVVAGAKDTEKAANVDDEPNLAVTGGDEPKSFTANAGGVAGSKTDALLAMRAGKTPLATTLKGIVAEGERMKSDRAKLAGEEATEKKELEGMQLGVRERWLGSWAGVLGGDAKQGAHGTDLKADIATHDDKIKKLDADIAAIPQRLHDATAKQLLADGDATFAALDQKSKAAHGALSLINDFASDVAKAKSDVSSAQTAEGWEQVDAGFFKQNGTGPDLAEMNARWQVSSAQSSLAHVKSRAPDVEKKLAAFGQAAGVDTHVKTTDTGNMWGWLADFSGSDIGVIFAGFLVSSNLRNAAGELDKLSTKVHSIQSAIKQSVDAADGDRGKYLDAAQARALDG